MAIEESKICRFIDLYVNFVNSYLVSDKLYLLPVAYPSPFLSQRQLMCFMFHISLNVHRPTPMIVYAHVPDC